MGAVRMRVQTADKNISIIHIIHDIAFSCEKVVLSESGEKYAQIKHSLQVKTVQNCSKQICWWIFVCLDVRGQQGMDFVTGGSVLRDYGLMFWSEVKFGHLVKWKAVFLQETKPVLKGKGSGVWPSMVTHTRNLSSAFNPSKCTLTAVNTHLEQWAAILRRPGSSWGIGALLKGLTSVMVLKVERALVIHSPHRQSLPDLGIEPATFGLQVQLSNH